MLLEDVKAAACEAGEAPMEYQFRAVAACDMCGSAPDAHRLLGMRLNASQGLRPKRRSGIAVSVKKCTKCALIFPDPMPQPARLTDHYGRPAEDYWTEDYFEEDPAYFMHIVRDAKALIGSADRIDALDIGAGIGKGMVALQKAGFNVSGIEASPDFHERAISRTGVRPEQLHLTSIEDAQFPAGSFDLVTMSFVLEHLVSPDAVLRKVTGWLKPNGVLLVEVPYSGEPIARLINLFYRLSGVNYVTHISPMHPPYHLYEFSEASFREHGKRAGYDVVRAELFTVTYPILPDWLDRLILRFQQRTKRGSMLRVWLRPRA